MSKLLDCLAMCFYFVAFVCWCLWSMARQWVTRMWNGDKQNPMYTQTEADCQECDGTGKFVYDNDSGPGLTPGIYKCPMCGGSGTLIHEVRN